MRKFFKILISVVITLYFSATMFYCFVAGTPDDGKGAVIYMMSAAGLSILFPAFTCGCIHYILYLRKKWMKGANDQDLWYDNNKYLAGYVVSENGYLITSETHQMAVL